ncbi:MAG: hypothetical protein KatS3mg009_1316 [Acidimicrobiia bacterium]|nr:MAG: hypothetical protein KatS3mg009_1316 [Acidimicrobiia bacterium]
MHRVAAALAIACAAAVPAACGGDDADAPPRPSAPPPTRAAATTTRPAPATTTTVPAPDLDAVRVRLTEVASGLDRPVALALRTGDPRLYVAEQSGRVRVVGPDGTVAPEPLLEIAVSDGNEQGLLGLTFSPDGGELYVHYTDPDGDSHVDGYTMAGDAPDPASRRELLFVPQPFPNHNGGQVTFGPDGMLYVTLGDGGAAGDPQQNAQDLSTLLGKILRIHPEPVAGAPYTVPGDNPFVGREGVRTEIWMYGLRNPWRFSFDRATGDVWIGDVGQNAWEEIDYAPAGEAGINWGWDALEATHEFEGAPPPGARDPIFELSHADGYCSVIGGHVYRGDAIRGLHGAYVFADHCDDRLIALVQEGGVLVDQRVLDAGIEGVTSFAEGPDGELYVLSRRGSVSRLDPA